jgi:hypothetical protein
MNIAERSLYILTARILWGCQLSPKMDAQGKQILIPSYDYVSGFNTQPKHFRFDLKARNKRRAEIIGLEYLESRKSDPLRH